VADDIRLNISADDEGAKRIIDALTEALRALTEQQRRSAQASNQQRDAKGRFAKAAQTETQALRAEIAAQKALLDQRIQMERQAVGAVSARTRAVSQQTQAVVRSLQQQTQAEMQAAAASERIERSRDSRRARAERRNERLRSEEMRASRERMANESRMFREQARLDSERVRVSRQESANQMAQARVRAQQLRVHEEAQRTQQARLAKETAQVKGTSRAEVMATREKMAAEQQRHARRMENLRREAAAALQTARRENLQLAHSNRMAQMAYARQSMAQRQAGQMAAIAARQQTLAMQQNVAAIRNQARALQGSRGAQQAFRGQMVMSTSAVGAKTLAVGGLIRQLAALGAVMTGYRGFKAFVDEGLKFNQIIETAQLGIGSLITGTSEMRDPFGNLIEGADALEIAMQKAERQVSKLRVAGLQTASTTDELVQAYQSAVAAGIAAGLNLDEIRKVTVQIVQAAGAIGLPMQQLEQEVRSVLDATIDRNSRVARVLGITNEQVRLAKEQNRLADMLNDKLQSFTVAGERAMMTFRVMKTNLQEAFQVFSGESTVTLFRALRGAGLRALDEMFDFDAAEVNQTFRPIIQAWQIFFDEMGDRIGRALTGALTGAANLAEWLRKNEAYVTSVSVAFFDMIGNVGRVVAELARGAGAIAEWITGGEGILGVLDSISGAMKTLADVIGGVVTAFQYLTSSELVNGMLLTTAAVAVLAVLFGKITLPIIAAKLAMTGLVAIGARMTAMIGRNAREARQAAMAHENHTRALRRQVNAYSDLVSEVRGLAEEKSETEDEKRLEGIRRREVAIIDRLIALYPQWKSALDNAKQGYVELTVVINEMNKAILTQVRTEALWAYQRWEQAEKDVKAFKRSREIGALDHLKEDEYNKQLRIREDSVRSFEIAMRTASETAQEAQRRFRELTEVELTRKVGDPDAKAGAIARMEKSARAAIAAIEAQLRTTEERLKDAYERSEISMQSYFDQLTEAQKTAASQKIDILKRLRTFQTDEGSIESTDSQIVRIQEELQRDMIANAKFLRSEQDNLADAVASAHVRLLELQGRQIEAAGLSAEAEFRKIRQRLETEIAYYQEALSELGSDDPARQLLGELVTYLERALTNINVSIKFQQTDAAVKELNEVLSRIQSEVERETMAIDLSQATGMARQDQIAQRVIALYGEQLTALRAVRDEFARTMEEMDASELEPARKKFEDMETQIRRVEIALVQAQEAAKTLRNALRDSLESGVEAMLTSGLLNAFNEVMRQQQEAKNQIKETAQAIEEALERQGIGVQQRMNEMRAYIDSANDGMMETVGVLDVLKVAFQEFANGVVRALQQVIAQMIAVRVAAQAMMLFSGGANASAGIPWQSGALPAATGGFIWGPGTETSDSIPARLSRGEYVLSAKAVKAIGVDTLDEINFGRSRPRIRRYNFAEGGLVQGGRQSTATFDGQMTVGLEEGLVLRHLESEPGQKLLVRTMSKNRQAMKKALGLR
jgi:hypothetical protein